MATATTRRTASTATTPTERIEWDTEVPGLGRLRVDRITGDDVRAWRDALAGASSSGPSDWALAVLSGMMRHAEALAVRRAGGSPCRGLRRCKTGFKAQRLGRSDGARLGAVLPQCEEAAPVLAGIVRSIALTGCCRGERANCALREHGGEPLCDDRSPLPRCRPSDQPVRVPDRRDRSSPGRGYRHAQRARLRGCRPRGHRSMDRRMNGRPTGLQPACQRHRYAEH